MSEAFDPYQRWLGISPEEQPPNHYRLLGIQLFENDAEVICAAANRQIAHVAQCGKDQPCHDGSAVLDELLSAQNCLLAADKKAAYDAQLWVALTARAEGWQAGGPPLEYHVKGAARYFWIQAKRWWIWQLRLPAAYQTLGECVYREGRSRERLAALFVECERVSERLKELSARSTSRGGLAERPRNTWGRVRDFLRRGTARVRVAMAGRRRRCLLQRMGRSVYEADGLSSGPEHLATPIHLARTRLAQLRGEIAQLAVVPAGQLLSPRRLAWMVIAVLSLPVLLFLWGKLSLISGLW